MYDSDGYYNKYKFDAWEDDKKYEDTKKTILFILKGQKVSLSEVRYLFLHILEDIERHNLVDM